MALTLYLHPLASFCHKVLIALYETGTPFESRVVDLADADEHARFLDLWPVGKIPVLRDDARDQTVPETSIIIEYLERHYPGRKPLIPLDAAQALEARLWDRFYDLYVQVPMQKIVTDKLRAMGENDRRGVLDARAALAVAYDMIERQVADRTFAIGESFTIADCAAAPALFYAGIVVPFDGTHPNLAAYFERLLERPSFQRTLAEARPYFPLFPYHDAIPARFL
ncbi:glutathione S-transferase family protein [Sinorhizobium garamanticum]|uniref:Glutathione S-transferase family protein n=1 Tax=Sinorhizobium garamanticum TaxID=680247 RepID=A0ABY8D6A3_9HYPH|nr:glutathione S-transferase family protein [Sinorhizobium garamanticum]WEX86401.1 glutathione S-transferase family protein [Sinorhizobium garamanticum]